MTKTMFRVLGVVASLVVGGTAMASNDLIAFCQGNNNAGSLWKIDPVTGAVIQLPCNFTISSTPGCFVIIDDNAYIGNDGSIYKINLSSFSVLSIRILNLDPNSTLMSFT